MKKKVVVFSGAGISAESGIKTFRDLGGLWEQYNVTEVASPTAWANEPELVLRFYNIRRKNVLESKPNAGHLALVELEKKYDVQIVTQNVDDLHERAGSGKVLHLHGEIRKSRSTVDASLVYDIDGPDLNLGDLCEKGSQLRPHIVWFGENVPAMTEASQIVSRADIFIVVGTSLQVYPAAGLADVAPQECPVYVVDPIIPHVYRSGPLIKFEEPASVGLPKVVNQLLNR